MAARARAPRRGARRARAPRTAIAKSLADFDLGSLRRLERTRMLVRAGPALGLMGTLIPLSPALDRPRQRRRHSSSPTTSASRSAITVLGLLIGAIAFGISLVRDRLYAQDLSDLEFVAATLTAEPEDARMKVTAARPPPRRPRRRPARRPGQHVRPRHRARRRVPARRAAVGRPHRPADQEGRHGLRQTPPGRPIVDQARRPAHDAQALRASRRPATGAARRLGLPAARRPPGLRRPSRCDAADGIATACG